MNWKQIGISVATIVVGVMLYNVLVAGSSVETQIKKTVGGII
jgi:hypothetical protein